MLINYCEKKSGLGFRSPFHFREKGCQARFRLLAFSLVEVVLAIAIVSFSFLVLVALLPIGIKSEQTSSSESSAVNLMHSLVTDLATTPLTNAGSTNNTYSIRFGLTPLPGNLPSSATPTVTTNYVTDDQQVTSATAAKYRVIINCYPANTNSGTYYTPPAALIQIFWPANAPTNSFQGSYESYATFPPYSL